MVRSGEGEVVRSSVFSARTGSGEIISGLFALVWTVVFIPWLEGVRNPTTTALMAELVRVMPAWAWALLAVTVAACQVFGPLGGVLLLRRIGALAAFCLWTSMSSNFLPLNNASTGTYIYGIMGLFAAFTTLVLPSGRTK